jgi:hypothetical protein
MGSHRIARLHCLQGRIASAAQPLASSVTIGDLVSYNSDFERAFIERSLALVQQYSGPYDAALLLNCLLGLLVVPKESCLAAIPETPIADLKT